MPPLTGRALSWLALCAMLSGTAGATPILERLSTVASRPSLSADGRIVAFEDDGVVILDRATGSRMRICGWAPHVSSTGRFVVLSSRCPLVPEDANGFWDVFVLDRESGSMELVSVGSDGTQGNGNSGIDDFEWAGATISSDGRFVAFPTRASNFDSPDQNEEADLFIRDRLLHRTLSVTLRHTVMGVMGYSDVFWGLDTPPMMPADGSFVAYLSSGSSALVLFSTATSTYSTEGLKSAGGGPYAPVISADGRFVAFGYTGDDLVPDDHNDAPDVFVFDRSNAAVELVSRRTDGEPFQAAASTGPSISGDGRIVAFEHLPYQYNPLPADASVRDILVRDRSAQTTRRVTIRDDCSDLPGVSWYPAVSADGRVVAFAHGGYSGRPESEDAVYLVDLTTPTCCGGPPCDDGNVCTVDRCDGQCVFTPIPCSDDDACTTDSCDPATGCIFTPISGLAGLACRIGRSQAETFCANPVRSRRLGQLRNALSRSARLLSDAGSTEGSKHRRLLQQAARTLRRIRQRLRGRGCTAGRALLDGFTTTLRAIVAEERR